MNIDDFDSIETEYPWQETPTKLIMYAIELAEEGGEFQCHIAYLLLDVGVETLFKTYLSIDNSISKAKTKHEERRDLLKSESFYKLVEGVKEATGDRLPPDFIGQVMYFHNIRNKMYHEGDGVTITQKNLADYTIFGEDLLEQLLGVSLKPEPIPDEERELVSLPQEFFDKAQRSRYINDVLIEIGKLETTISAAIGFLKPAWGSPEFIDDFEAIWRDYPDYEEDEDFRRRADNQEKRRDLFQDLTGLPDSNYDHIDFLVKDRHLFYFSYLLDYLHFDDPNEHLTALLINKKFANGEILRQRDNSPRWTSEGMQDIDEVEKRYMEIVIWMTSIKEKIQSIFEK